MTDLSCPACQAPAQDGARFCPSCGTRLDAGPPAAEIRKMVTALFCDVSGSTSLGQELDPESLRSLMEQYFAAASAVVSHHGGTVEKFVGDAVMAVFGVPTVHEDDALRACRAALDLLEAADRLDRDVAPTFGVRFGVRMGLESGEVLVGDQRRGSTFATGPAINVAARLEQAAGPGECLLGPQCHELVRGQVEVGEPVVLSLAGIREPIPVVRLVGATALEDLGARPARTALVGRSRELALLRQAFDRSATDRTCQLATVLGPAGVGKTRLVNELITELEPQATVLRGRCLSYGEGVTYWPLVDVVRQAAGLTGAEGEGEARMRVAALVAEHPQATEIVAGIAPIAGLGGTPTSAEECSWAFQRLFETMAVERPVVLVLDDLHWAEPRLLDIVEWICDWSREAPLFVLGLARPELLDVRPAWSAGRGNAVSAMLEPLDEQEADALLTALLDGSIPSVLAESVRAAAGGNPLFVEQLVGMLIEDGVLRREGTAWTSYDGVAPLRIPPTITALLAARLDRLSAQERAVLGPAAVVGDVFYRDAVADLSNTGQAEVAATLRSLVRKNLVLPARSDLPGQDALRFGHTLVKDAAYDALPKSVRAQLHERFARWLGARAEGSAYDDLVGSHLEAAYLLRADLGPLDRAAVALGVESAQRLSAAGRSLLHADDAAAAALLRRALRLQPAPGPDRWAAQLDLADALNQTLDLAASEGVAAEVRVEAEAAGNTLWEALARVTLWSVVMSVRPTGAVEQLRRATEDAARLLDGSADDVQLTRLYVGMSDLAYGQMQTGPIRQALDLAASHAERSGRPRYAQALRGQALLPLLEGDCPADQGLAESKRFAETASGLLPRAYGAMGVTYFATLLGLAEEARTAAQVVEDVVTEVRTLHAVITQAFTVSYAEIAAGDPAEAQRILDRAAQRLGEVGESSYLSTILGLRAHIHLTHGRVTEARSDALRALELGGPDDLLTRAHAEAALGWIAAVDGDAAEAARLAASSAAALEAGDVLVDRAFVHIAAAEAMQVLGDLPSSRRHRLAAIEQYRAKGSPVAVSRQEALLPT